MQTSKDGHPRGIIIKVDVRSPRMNVKRTSSHLVNFLMPAMGYFGALRLRDFLISSRGYELEPTCISLDCKNSSGAFTRCGLHDHASTTLHPGPVDQAVSPSRPLCRSNGRDVIERRSLRHFSAMMAVQEGLICVLHRHPPPYKIAGCCDPCASNQRRRGSKYAS